MLNTNAPRTQMKNIYRKTRNFVKKSSYLLCIQLKKTRKHQIVRWVGHVARIDDERRKHFTDLWKLVNGKPRKRTLALRNGG